MFLFLRTNKGFVVVVDLKISSLLAGVETEWRQCHVDTSRYWPETMFGHWSPPATLHCQCVSGVRSREVFHKYLMILQQPRQCQCLFYSRIYRSLYRDKTGEKTKVKNHKIMKTVVVCTCLSRIHLTRCDTKHYRRSTIKNNIFTVWPTKTTHIFCVDPCWESSINNTTTVNTIVDKRWHCGEKWCHNINIYHFVEYNLVTLQQ